MSQDAVQSECLGFSSDVRRKDRKHTVVHVSKDSLAESRGQVLDEGCRVHWFSGYNRSGCATLGSQGVTLLFSSFLCKYLSRKDTVYKLQVVYANIST